MGIDHAALASVCDTIAATRYAADPSRLNLDLDAYGALVPDTSRFGLVLRPMSPDCRSAGNLAAKIALARERGLDGSTSTITTSAGWKLYIHQVLA